MSIIGLSKEEYEKRLKSLDDSIMDYIDQVELENFLMTHRIKTPNGVELCSQCNVMGIYQKPEDSKENLIYITVCESCGYKPYSDY